MDKLDHIIINAMILFTFTERVPNCSAEIEYSPTYLFLLQCQNPS